MIIHFWLRGPVSQNSNKLGKNKSGKLIRLIEMLEEILDSQEKVIIFTQFVAMGNLLQKELESYFKEEIPFISGKVDRVHWQQIIQEFQSALNYQADNCNEKIQFMESTSINYDNKNLSINENIESDSDGNYNESVILEDNIETESPKPKKIPSILILSLKVGGIGLNLTAATHVFHFDRWWNPAVENQATDRVYRIGQKKKVEIHKFICSGTLEERIDEMIDQKKALAENIIGTGELWITEMSTDQLKELFKLNAEIISNTLDD